MTDQTQPTFQLLKMYVKDISFENPNAPAIYNGSRESKVDMQLKLEHRDLGEDTWEVVLNITATVSDDTDDKPIVRFVAEIQHAVLVRMSGMTPEMLQHALTVDCPTTLFPYTRQIMSQLTVDGGFSPFLMSPINFAEAAASAAQTAESVERNEVTAA